MRVSGRTAPHELLERNAASRAYRAAARASIILVVLVALQGCAWRGEGLIEAGGAHAALRTPTGARMVLVLREPDRPLATLHGYRVLLDGRRLGRKLWVRRWSVAEGVRGLGVWIGRLERKGYGVGLLDHNSGAFYTLGEGAESLTGAVGHWVVVEGYVDGPHRVRVLHHRVLDHP